MPHRSRHDDIWAVYQKYGGDLSLHRLTQYCFEEGVWTDEEQGNMVFAAAQRECHRVLSMKTATGLPVAGSTQKRDNGNRRWRQLQLWDYDDALYNLKLRVKQTIKRDWKTVEILHAYIEERYGQAPTLPQWVMPPGEDLWWEDISDDDEE
jgi:hypothetical protein